MEPVIVITGTAVPLDRSDVDTDQIIPSDWLKRVERTGFGAGLFSEWRDDSRLRAQPGALPGRQHPRGRPELRHRLVTRARGVGAHGLRLPGGHVAALRRHLPQQLARRWASSPRSEPSMRSSGTRSRTTPTSRSWSTSSRSASPRRRSASTCVRARRLHAVPAAQRPRRHRAHAAHDDEITPTSRPPDLVPSATESSRHAAQFDGRTGASAQTSASSTQVVRRSLGQVVEELDHAHWLALRGLRCPSRYSLRRPDCSSPSTGLLEVGGLDPESTRELPPLPEAVDLGEPAAFSQASWCATAPAGSTGRLVGRARAPQGTPRAARRWARRRARAFTNTPPGRSRRTPRRTSARWRGGREVVDREARHDRRRTAPSVGRQRLVEVVLDDLDRARRRRSGRGRARASRRRSRAPTPVASGSGVEHHVEQCSRRRCRDRARARPVRAAARAAPRSASTRCGIRPRSRGSATACSSFAHRLTSVDGPTSRSRGLRRRSRRRTSLLTALRYAARRRLDDVGGDAATR